MSEIFVSTSADLVAAIKNAAGGDTIRLASGTYDTVALRGIHFDKAVTITSADAKKPAELTGLRMTDVSGLNISNLTLSDKNAATLYDFQVSQSSNINFDHILVQGPAGESGYVAAPFMIRDSQNISVTNSEFRHVQYGLSMLDNKGVTITGNYFHDIRTDGVRGGGSSDVTISNNYFTDFHPAAGDHPDAIQFWTTNEKTSASNITITDNVIMRGNGEPMQGIFMRDEVGNLPYKNVVIDGNLIVGGMYNGVYVGNAQGLQVTNNTVTGYADQASWIRTNDLTTLSGNSAQTYIIDGVNVTSPKGNTVVAPANDGGIQLSQAWLGGKPVAAAYLNANAKVTESILTLDAAKPVAAPVVVATIAGTSGADTLKAAKLGDSILQGGDGNDNLTGGTGNTRMEGGAGNDIYNVNSVRDLVVEGSGGGDDTVYAKIDYTLTANVETLRMAASGLVGHGNELDNRMVGSAGVDTMYGEGGDDTLQGLDGDDILDGGAGDDSLNGGAGEDTLYGGTGDDKLLGGEGHDTLFGGAGNDWLEGGAGNDVMSGGAGKDSFYFRQGDLGGYDTITDFSTAEGDKIVVSLIDANILTAKDDGFKFLGTSDFTRHAGELRYSLVNGGSLVQADVNGDGVADLSIFVQGVTKLLASDFVL